jgi:hypothetical protein
VGEEISDGNDLELEAARQQLAVAIRLFFAEESAVAVHTLTAAWRMRRSSATPPA